MRSSVLYNLGFVVLLGAALAGCKKKSPLSIDNNQIVQKPYSLYTIDTIGALWHSNDGVKFVQVSGVGSGGGVEARAITTSDTNILYILNNAFVSEDNGNNFNPVVTGAYYANPNAFGQSMICDVPSFNRVYLASNAGTGVSYSDSNGRINTWKNDSDPNLTAKVTSFTQIGDGTLIGYSDVTKDVFTLNGTDQQWKKTTGTPLPAGQFFISHFQNMVLAADRTGAAGVWYSTNKGTTWQQFTGLPANVPILSINTLFEQAILVGTEGMGVYRVVPQLSNNFEPSNDGLGSNARVTGIAAKSNVYKNNAVKQYVYVSTNLGIYRSENLGENWVNVLSEGRNFSAIY